MINDYPFKINNTAIPYPDSWNQSPTKMTNSFTTEDGHTQKVIVRATKFKAECSFTVTSFWLKKFLEYRAADSIEVSVYDAQLSGYKTYTCFIDDESFRQELIPASRFAQNTQGLWRISFSIEEY